MSESKNLAAGSIQVLACFDLDGTLFEGQSQRALLTLLRKCGYVQFSTYAALLGWFILYKLGIVRKPERVMRTAYRAFRGHTIAELSPIADEVVRQLMSRAYISVLTRLHAHQAAGDDIVIITNTVNIIAQRIAAHLGVENCFCSTLETVGSAYTGELIQTEYGGAKVSALEKYRSQRGGRGTLYVYADHNSDRPLLEKADHAVVVNPSASLRTYALSQGWEILEAR